MTDSSHLPLTAGSIAPAFTLTSDEGTSVSLADYAGQRVILFFFPKAGTPGCTTQACGFRDAFPKIQEANGHVIGISPDSPAALAKWRAAEQLPYTLLSDPDHAIATAYGVWGERSMYGKKYLGIIRSHFVIAPDRTIADAQVKISPKDSISKGVAALIGQ